MLERLKHTPSTGAGIVAAIITIAAYFGLDLSGLEQIFLSVGGAVMSVVGLFYKPKK